MGVGSSLKMLSKLSRVADDVVESGAKYATKGTVAKNVTNGLSSNMTKGNVRAMKNAGAEMVDAVKNEGKRASNQVINSRTAQNALDNFNGGGTGMDAAESVIHPEVAATYTKGGGGRGRGGNRGYNNRTNYGNGGRNQQTVNFKNKNQQSKFFNNTQDTGNQSKFFNNAQAESTLDVDTPVNRQQRRRQGNRRTTTNNANVPPEMEVNEQNIHNMINNMEGNQYYHRNTAPSSEPKSRTYSYQNQQTVEPEFDSTVNKQTGPETSTGGGGNGNGGNGNSSTATGGPEGGPNNSGNGNNRSNRERGNSERFGKFNEKFGEFGEQAKDTFFGGIHDTYDNIRNGEQGFFEALGNAHMNDDGSMNWRRAAGTFMTASAAARVASGGGLYKDRYGNPNLIGVPFI